jgi:CheY-like chemotaxis protein
VTRGSSKASFRILVVDDEPLVLGPLVRLMEAAISRVEIDCAGTIKEASALIERSQQEGRPYDLAILDFKLPFQVGHQPAVDTSLCEALERDAVPVIHYTAWPDDEAVQAHMRTKHLTKSLAGAPVRLITRTTTEEWVEDIIGLIAGYQRWVISNSVRRRMGDFFGVNLGDDDSQRLSSARSHATSGRTQCGTYALLELQKDIIENWHVLDPKLKSEIKSTFAVVKLDEEDEPKRLSLFPIDTLENGNVGTT